MQKKPGDLQTGFARGLFYFLHSSRPKPHLRQETSMKTKKLFKTKIVVNVEPKTKEER